MQRQPDGLSPVPRSDFTPNTEFIPRCLLWPARNSALRPLRGLAHGLRYPAHFGADSHTGNGRTMPYLGRVRAIAFPGGDHTFLLERSTAGQEALQAG